MADDHARDELAELRAELTADFTTQLAAQEARFAARLAQRGRPRPRRRIPRRFLPLALVALLVLLTPLSLRAASPFNDLTGGVHDPNIGLIYDAGITKGCVPNVSYCPTANVTREEMASFLARTAGLGANPPVVNAKTAQTATLATTAGHADSANTATNAAALGGQPPSAYLAAGGDTVMTYAAQLAQVTPGTGTVEYFGAGYLSLTIPAGGQGQVVVPLARPTTTFGRALAVKGLRICYAADLGVSITGSQLYASQLRGDLPTPIIDNTVRAGDGTDTCYDLAATTPGVTTGQNTLYIPIKNTPGASRRFSLYSVTLTLASQP